jgi:hypothetical protein
MTKNDPRYRFRLAMLAMDFEVSHTNYDDIYTLSCDYFDVCVTATLTDCRTGVAAVEWQVTDTAPMPTVLHYGRANLWMDAQYLIKSALQHFASATGDEGDDHMNARVW